VSARYVPRETVGYQQLDTYGSWSQDPAYGAVWMPREVPAQWAPYRDGHWAWVSPWGWTWVDDAPWGFAPFHYGRWAQIGPRWAWVPGRLAPRPVYAPALVAFVGGGSGGVSWNISIGGAARPGVGWFPLAPGEAYRPAYRVSPRYITQVNHNIVVNNTVNVTNVYRYQRQPGAVTAVSRDDFTRGRPVRGQQHALSRADLDRAQVVADRSAIPQRPLLVKICARTGANGRGPQRQVDCRRLPPWCVRWSAAATTGVTTAAMGAESCAPRQEESIGQRALREQAQTDTQNRARGRRNPRRRQPQRGRAGPSHPAASPDGCPTVPLPPNPAWPPTAARQNRPNAPSNKPSASNNTSKGTWPASRTSCAGSNRRRIHRPARLARTGPDGRAKPGRGRRSPGRRQPQRGRTGPTRPAASPARAATPAKRPGPPAGSAAPANRRRIHRPARPARTDADRAGQRTPAAGGAKAATATTATAATRRSPQTARQADRPTAPGAARAATAVPAATASNRRVIRARIRNCANKRSGRSQKPAG
jgi:hypothetical protein